MYTFSMALALGKMRAHDRAVQPPAQPRLVACLGPARSAPATPIATPPAASHGRGGSRGGRGRGGRGRRSQATIAAEKAKLAAFLAAKYGTEGSRTARAMAEQQAGGDANDDDEVQMLGEQTWQERDAAAREAAVEIDD